MNTQSRQAFRMIKFVAELKKNSHPNAHSFAQLLRELDIDENVPCACTPRTVARDIEALKRDYHAPIEYDARNRGYYLRNPEWEFQCPILDENVLSMTLLGTRLASDFLPEPIKSELDHAMEQALTSNSSEFFDEATIDSMICATGIKASVDPAIFKKVFDAWRRHQTLAFLYKKPNDEPKMRRMEPHIVAFHGGVWYVKGFDCGTKNVKCYAIQRIVSAEYGGERFETDKKMLEDTRKNGLFGFSRIEGIRLLCDASIAFYLYERQKAHNFALERRSDGSVLVALPPAVEHEAMRWILGEEGRIEVLHPPELREKVAEAARRILERNSGAPSEMRKAEKQAAF